MSITAPNRQGCVWVLVAPLLALLVMGFDPASRVVSRQDGTVIDGYPMRSRFRNGYVTLRVLLPSGLIVFASAPADSHYPYAPGTEVTVTTFETLLFHRQLHEAVAQ